MTLLQRVIIYFKHGGVFFDFKTVNELLLVKFTWRGIYFLGFSTAYWISKFVASQKDKISELEILQVTSQKEKMELERNLIVADNAHLRSQINPHLLFNSLNFIYNSIHEISDNASETVILLADIMRYSLSEMDDNGKVDLNDEILNIRNLIKLNQIRFNNKLHLTFEADGDYSKLKIIPLSLLTLVENLYKHGDLTDSDSPGKISISFDDGVFHLQTKNKARKANKEKNIGIGLINLKNRLQNFYSDKFSLVTTEANYMFIVDLKIKL